jgi:predicted O-methyltransferase YrrM
MTSFFFSRYPADPRQLMIDNTVNGFHVSGDVDYLSNAVKSIQKGTIVEVGSYCGLSAYVMAKTIDTFNTGSTLYCHDLWPDGDEWDLIREDAHIPPKCENIMMKFTQNLEYFIDVNIVKTMRGNSADTLKLHRAATVDFFFIDGDHSYEGCLSDLEDALQCAKPGAVISGHDCVPHSDVERAVIEFCERHNLDWRKIPNTWHIFEIKCNNK